MANNKMVFNKENFANQILNYRKNGEQGIRTSGIEIDEILANERSSPGADKRNGVNVIARPSPVVVEEIKRMQDHLKNLEPHQYYYPCQDLHMTVLEICFEKTLEEVGGIIEKINDHLSLIFNGLPGPVLETPILGFDQKGCAVNFIPQNPDLHLLRDLLRKRLEKTGVQLQARYLPASAHVSFFRYIQQIKIDNNQWADYLVDTEIDTKVQWKVSNLYITWGANWYGKNSQIHEIGPFFTSPSSNSDE